MKDRIVSGTVALLAAGVLCLHGETVSAQTAGKVLTIYNRASVPANSGIGTGSAGPGVDGYRYVNIFVEWDQFSLTEKPVTLEVGFALDATGLQASGRYFTFEENFVAPANPQFVRVTGAASWHGSPPNKSAYIARLPVMGPYLQIWVFNQEALDRRVSVRAYLTP